MGPSVDEKAFSFLKPREEPWGQISQIQEKQLGTPEKSLAKECGQSADGKREKSRHLSPEVNQGVIEEFADAVDNDHYTGTSNQAIEGNPLHEVIATSPLKRRKKDDKKASEVPVAERVSTGKEHLSRQEY